MALKGARSITTPVPEDRLWIVTDASLLPGAVGATLYSVRHDKPMLSGFFNLELKEFQRKWNPCEVEGIAIAAALQHWAPYIIQSVHRPEVLTDSKPCVEASMKLSRGQYSNSARLSTFLSAVGRYNANVRHVAGAANLSSDFASRNPIPCHEPHCQMCTFVKELSDSVVMSVSVADIVEGRVKVPYGNKTAWLATQNECHDLRKTVTFLTNGTVPSRNAKNMKNVRRYLSNKVVLSREGLVVKKESKPFTPVTERIVVPQQSLHGLLMALHLQLGHPSSYQLQRAFERQFFALNLTDAANLTVRNCHQCEAIKDIPKSMVEQSTEDPPTEIGYRCAADIVRRCGQKILIIRETVTSYTLAEFIPDETTASVTESLVRLCHILRPSGLTQLVVRVDPASAHQSMFLAMSKKGELLRDNIRLEIGRIKNKNKNPVIDKAIKELHRELLIISPEGGRITSSTLSQSVAMLNSRYRAPGLSSHEQWTQRDQVTGCQLPINDMDLISGQHERRELNHQYSQKSKAHGRPKNPTPKIDVGSLVYLYNDRDKTSARQRYLVTSISGGWCQLRKFTSQLFGSKAYDVRLEECYTIPTLTEIALPEVPSDSESEYYSSEDESHPLKLKIPVRVPTLPRRDPRTPSPERLPKRPVPIQRTPSPEHPPHVQNSPDHGNVPNVPHTPERVNVPNSPEYVNAQSSPEHVNVPNSPEHVIVPKVHTPEPAPEHVEVLPTVQTPDKENVPKKPAQVEAGIDAKEDHDLNVPIPKKLVERPQETRTFRRRADKDYKPPDSKKVAPATMERSKRTKKPPDHLKDYVQH